MIRTNNYLLHLTSNDEPEVLKAVVSTLMWIPLSLEHSMLASPALVLMKC